MLLGQELKFKNKLCNLKLGTFFSALPGHRPGYSYPHAWRPIGAKALYDLRPALSPVSVSLSPVFGVIAGFLYLYRRFWGVIAGEVCNFSFIFIFLPLPFPRS